jgi:tetratricopeptide (TPR) repeat protein
MQLPSDELPLCTLCGKKPATEKYMLSGHAEMVCAACLERRQVRDALEDKLLHILALERRKQYDEALACLDTILEANRDRDHDGWLARSIAHDRAVILFEAGRYAEALQAYDAWAELGFEDVSQRWMHADGTARTLEAFGRDREAVAALEDALGYEDPKYLPSVLGVLTELVRFSEKLALPVDPKWLRIAEAVAKRYGVDMPVHDSPGQAILTLAETVRSMVPKRPSE